MLFSLISVIQSVDFSFHETIIIFLISFFSNTFSAISGGGAGLVQLPALILFGIPYYQGLAIHKFATVALGIGSSIRNIRSLRNDIYVMWQILIFGIPGVIVGASIVEFIQDEYLYLLLGLFSILLAFYSFNKKDFGLIARHKKVNFFQKLKFSVLIFFVGILNGSISSGTGLLVTTLLIKTFGINFLKAVSLTFFTVGIFWNAVGAIFLIKIGSLPLNLLIILIAGSFVGGFFGAHLSNINGNKIIKKTFTGVCLLIGLSLLFKSLSIFN